MPDETRSNRHERDLTFLKLFLKLFLKAKPGEISEEEVCYFRAHPDQIDEVSAPVRVHLVFLWAGGLLGAAFVATFQVARIPRVALP